MKALEAAQLSAKNEDEEFQKILTGIDLEARQGYYHLDVPGEINIKSRHELDLLGYQVHRHSVYTRVSWEHLRPKPFR